MTGPAHAHVRRAARTPVAGSGHDPRTDRAAAGRIAAELATAGIRPKLRLDTPGDAYERDADDVADQVMRTPAPSGCAPWSGCCTTCGPAVQRSPAADAGSGDTSGDLPGDLESRVRTATGGSALSDELREFYEPRFGRDLGHVRLHTGPEAVEMSDRIGALAFTHRNHIWLGAGARPERSHLLAHELTHVVQQGGHRPLGADPGDETVQRFAPYWEPASYNGTTTHREVLNEMSAQGDGIFVEAPIPNAKRTGAGFGAQGRADIYDATTTIGVQFTASGVPAALTRSGTRYRGTSKGLPPAAPVPGSLQSVRRVGDAPPHIGLADLKPDPRTIEAHEGPAQIANYQEGIALAAAEVNEKAAAGDTRPEGATWHPVTGPIGSVGLGRLIPERFRAPATAQEPRPVVLKQNGRAKFPPVRALARMVVHPDPTRAGVVNYFWVRAENPSGGTGAAAPRVLELGRTVTAKIVDPLRSPLEKVRRRRAAVRPLAGGRVQRQLQDRFDLAAWRENRRATAAELRGLRGTSDLRDATVASLVAEEHQAAVRQTGVSPAVVPESTRAAGSALDRATFWTGTAAGFLGVLRRTFGRTFVRVADAYERMRARFRDSLRNRRAATGGGLAGAAIRAVLSVLKMASQVVVRRTLDLLRDSLLDGVRRKLVALIPADSVEAVEEAVAEARALHDQLEQQAELTAESVVASVLPGFEEYGKKFEAVMSIVGDISRVVNLVRWGVRAVACVSPPAVGCLWALAQAALERIAAEVVASCWFQRKLAPFVVGLRFLRETLPRGLAQLIIDGVRRLLPAGLHDVFSDVTAVPPDAGEVECDESEGPGRPLTDHRRAVLELQERLGEERFVALIDLLRARGVAAGAPLDRATCERLGAGASALSTAELRRIAENPSTGVPVPLAAAIESLASTPARSPVEPGVPAEPVPAAAGDGAGEEPVYETIVTASRDGDRGIPTDTLSADARPSDRAAQGVRSDYRVRIVRVSGALVRGAVVHIDVEARRRVGGRSSVRRLNGLEVRVADVVPSEQRRGEVEAFLEVTRDQEFAFPSGERDYYREQTEFVYRTAAVTGR